MSDTLHQISTTLGTWFHWVVELPGGWRLAVEIFLTVLVALILDFIQRMVLKRLRHKARHTRNLWDDAIVDALYRPLSAAIWIIGIGVAIQLSAHQLDVEISKFLNIARKLALVVAGGWFLIRLVRRLEHNFIRSRQRDGAEVDYTTVDAVGKLLRATIIITVGMIALQTLQVDISGLLAFGGVGGIAVGFAARDLLANFFGGLTVHMDRPFVVGDWVRSPDRQIEGTVERIGWRSTRIRTFDQRPLYVPNSIFVNIVLENPSRMHHRRINETIGLRYDDFAVVTPILEEVRELLNNHEDIAQEQIIMVNFSQYGAHSLDFFIYCFTRTRDWATYNQVKEKVLLQIGNIIERHGAEIAFPTTTLHLADTIRLARDAESEAQQQEHQAEASEHGAGERARPQRPQDRGTRGPDEPGGDDA